MWPLFLYGPCVSVLGPVDPTLLSQIGPVDPQISLIVPEEESSLSQ